MPTPEEQALYRQLKSELEKRTRGLPVTILDSSVNPKLQPIDPDWDYPTPEELAELQKALDNTDIMGPPPPHD